MFNNSKTPFERWFERHFWILIVVVPVIFLIPQCLSK